MPDRDNAYCCYVFFICHCWHGKYMDPNNSTWSFLSFIYLFIRLTTVHDQIEKLLCFCKSFSIILKDILYFAIVKGDEVSLQRALNIVHMNSHEYVAVLFYASWCPFSRTFRPSFSILSSLYPSIPHFAIEESAVRPRFVYH